MNLKKIASLVLALVLVLAMAVPAFAAAATGTITVSGSSTVPAVGKTLKAYKILDVEVFGTSPNESYVYTVPNEMKAFYVGYFKNDGVTGEEANFSNLVAEKINGVTDKFDFALKAAKWAKDNGVTAQTGTTSTTNDKQVVFKDIPVGYYAILDETTDDNYKPISAVMLDTMHPNMNVTIKADVPTIDKKIDGTKDTDDTTSGDVINNTAAVGDYVPYKITTKVPDMKGYKKYYFAITDTLSKGLTYVGDADHGVVVKMGEDTLTACTAENPNGDYCLTTTPGENESTVIKIEFHNFIQYTAGTDITVTYAAQVNENAIIGTTGNPNEVYLDYSNNPNSADQGESGEPDSETPHGTTPEKKVETFITAVTLKKVDPAGNALKGAEFELKGKRVNTVLLTGTRFEEANDGTYYELIDGSYTETPPAAEGENPDYKDTSKKYKKVPYSETKLVGDGNKDGATDVTITAFVDDQGVLKFSGLNAGTYTISEIKAPDGYNLLESAITLEITCGKPAAIDRTCTWTYKWSNNVTADKDDASIITVENRAGTLLPTTGGTGTTIFYVAGSIMLIGAAVILITKRRMGAEK